jgi:hypothetical protein
MTDVVVEPDVRNKGPRPGRMRPVTVDASGHTSIRRPVGYKRRVKEVADQVTIRERRARAYTLRVGGFSNLDIGLYLHADPALNTNKDTPDGLPGGYGWQNYRDGKPPLQGEALRISVSRDLTRGLESAAKYEALNREEYVQLEVAGLNAAQAAMWPKVLRGDTVAAERFVKLSERRAKLLGLDAPVQAEIAHEVNVHVEGVQPNYNPEYAAQMFAALQEVGAIAEPPALPVLDVVDAEVVPADGGQH